MYQSTHGVSRPILCLIIAVSWNSVILGPIFTLATTDFQHQAYASIMNGITELNFEGSSIPDVFILSGDHAFPLVVNTRGQTQMAASLYGTGRFIALCHETFLTTFPSLIVNAVNWLRREGSTNMRVGVQEGVSSVADILSKSGFQVKVLQKFSSDQDLAVYVTDAWGTNGNDQELIAFMKSGGGVLIAAQSWHWATTHPTENFLLDYWGNKVSAMAGVYFAPQYGDTTRIPIGPKIPPTKSIDVSFKADLDALLKEVPELEVSPDSLVSEILVHGFLAFPIAWDTNGKVYMAGGYYGKGRVIVAGHNVYLDNNEKFWDNALHWLDQGRRGLVGIDPYHNKQIVEKSSLTVEQTEFKAGLSVFVSTSWRDGHIREIQEFVAEGGGLVVAGHAWTFVQRSNLNYLTECPGNKLLYPMGLSILVSKASAGVQRVPDLSTVKQKHLHTLLDLFVAFVTQSTELTPEQTKTIQEDMHYILTFLKTENYQSYAYQHAQAMIVEALKQTALPELNYVVSTSNSREKLLLSVVPELYKLLPDQEEMVQALHRNPPQLPTVQNQRIVVNADTGEGSEWLSTGLYLSPGMKTTVTVPTQMVNKEWQVQIGCQTDHLDSSGELKRAPVVYERFPLLSETTLVHNFWGGLLYLIAPPNTMLTGAEVTVQQAVRAPYYKAGVTTLSDWAELRTSLVPWAELEMENIVLTVPTSVVRNLDRPDEVAALWDKIMNAIADLSTIPHKFKRKERLVADVQISAGWMHAGYPVMVQTPRATVVTDLEEVKREGLWGPLHELGHNQQGGPSEFSPHTGEATCNLWALYVHETVMGINMESYQGNSITRQFRIDTITKWVNDGRKLADWYKWVALETYIQLQEKFGWDAFKKVFAAYRAMDETQAPTDNPGKMNLYAVTFSQAVGVDVSAFLKSWSWPISEETEKTLSTLPAWTDHPMVQYNQ